MKKKIFKAVSLLTFALAASVFVGRTSYAYNFTDYECTDDGYIVVCNKESEQAKNQVVLYLYTDTSDRNVKNIDNHLLFDCTGGSVVEGRIRTPLVYQFSPLNAKSYATLDNGDVWVWQFFIEDGEYEFSSPVGSSSYGTLPNIYVLDSGLKFPAYKEGYGVTHFDDPAEKVLVNKDIRLYAMYGGTQWREENVSVFEEWAKETELSFRSIEDGMTAAEAETVEEIDVPVESTPPPTLEQIPNPMPEQIEIPEATPEDASNSWIDLLKGAAAVVVFSVLGFVVAKKKD